MGVAKLRSSVYGAALQVTFPVGGACSLRMRKCVDFHVCNVKGRRTKQNEVGLISLDPSRNLAFVVVHLGSAARNPPFSSSLFSKVPRDVLYDCVRSVLQGAVDKKRKFRETVDLQIALKNYDPQKDKRFSGTVK